MEAGSRVGGEEEPRGRAVKPRLDPEAARLRVWENTPGGRRSAPGSRGGREASLVVLTYTELGCW